LPVPIHDILEIIPQETHDQINLEITGIDIPGDVQKNLCVKAALLIKSIYPHIRGLNIYLHKSIPTGAGLGGGSANGAFTLVLLNKLFQLNISSEKLAELALTLGSDCPFFIYNCPCFATGRGERFTPLSLPIENYKFVLIHPGIHVPTSIAFSKIKPAAAPLDLLTLQDVSPEHWKNCVHNAFEPFAIKEFPVIGEIKQDLYKKGAVFASMTGTGSSVFGIFEKNTSPVFQYPRDWILNIQNK
jgi:4-diphosphocytidyl-2-C-methyl-D-erythritol kinase